VTTSRLDQIAQEIVEIEEELLLLTNFEVPIAKEALQSQIHALEEEERQIKSSGNDRLPPSNVDISNMKIRRSDKS
jgi:hypothetical protein